MSLLGNLREQVLGIDIILTLKFGLVGATGFAFNYAFLYLFVNSLGLNILLAEVIATGIALQATFVMHNWWTYSGQQLHVDHFRYTVKQRYLTFMSSNIVGSILTIITFAVLNMVITSNLASLGLAAIIGTTWNYFMNLLVTWKPE